ncbi:MAG: hypothetical protein HRU23_05875 [Gammaproteobacteria bacterium]|nr:hypothetical protein [Gammaproteobacteria bacterium]
MKKMSSAKMLQKIAMYCAGLLFIAFAGWLYANQQNINHHSNIATQLSFSQANAALLQRDIENLLKVINQQDDEVLISYIEDNSNKHKEWLTSLLIGSNNKEPLALFARRYLSVLVQIQVSSDHEAAANNHKLLRLIEDVTLSQENIIYLSQQRILANLSQLNISIAMANIILLCLSITFIATLVINYVGFCYQVNLTKKYQRLSLYFIDHPSILLRISTSGRIKYFNKSAETLIKQLQFDKYKLLPEHSREYIKQVVAQPERVVQYQHYLDDCLLDCDMRFCKSSQQIFVTISQPAAQASQNKLVESAIPLTT